MTSPSAHPADSSQSFVKAYYLGLLIAGASLLLASTLLNPDAFQLFPFLLGALFVALCVIFPLPILPEEIYLDHVITLGLGFLFGVPTAGWAVVLGTLAGYAVRRVRQRSVRLSLPAAMGWMHAGHRIGRHLLALILPLFLAGFARGAGQAELFLPRLLATLLGFALLHSLLILLDLHWVARHPHTVSATEIFWLLLVDAGPAPFILLVVLAYPSNPLGTLLVLGSVPVAFSVLAYILGFLRLRLQRRQQEFAAIDRVSQVLRASLDLDALLSVIHHQVSGLLNVDCFYVALLDETKESIWYPLAVKEGLRREWAPRPLQDRLTDSVIREGQPLLFPGNGSLSPAELPPSETTPTAWIGVPLISGDQIIGCLALFSLQPGDQFQPEDLELLVALSGSISVGISNALLHAATRRRTAQLEQLNRISALISASLDLDDVFTQICQAVVQVSTGQHSAVFMLGPENERLYLAQSYRLSEAFIRKLSDQLLAGRQDSSGQIDLSQNYLPAPPLGGHSLCLETGQPVYTKQLGDIQGDIAFQETLVAEGILSVGSFPLSTPEGKLGFLSVYYDQPHDFRDEEIYLLQTFAAQAALAVSNARLYGQTDLELNQSVAQLSILGAVGRDLAAATRSDRLLERILDYARQHTSSPWAMLSLYDPATDSLEVRAAHGYPPGPRRFSADQGLAARAISSQQVVNSGDTHQEHDYLDLSNGAARSQLTVPLVREGQVLGILTLEHPKPYAYSAVDVSFISQLANQAAIAIQNARLLQQVVESRERLATVLDTVEEAILMVAQGGEVLVANKALHTIAGIPPEKLIGKRLQDLDCACLLTIGYPEEVASQLADSLARGKLIPPISGASKLSTSLTERFIERTFLPVSGANGQIHGWIIVLRDITEARQIAETRELINETLVHDLRSPLSAVIGALDVIASSLPPGSPPDDLTLQAVQIGRRATRRTLNLVESLLDIARMQSGSIDLFRVPLNLHTLTVSILSDFLPQAAEFGILLRNELPLDLARVSGDSSKIQRVLINLLDNALKFTPSGGEVIISGEQDSEMVLVRVSDTGPGIPEGFREKVFERFTQIPGRPGRRRGSGLGLTFCRLAVEAHGGRIWIEPGDGGGSVFAFTLPVFPGGKPGGQLQPKPADGSG